VLPVSDATGSPRASNQRSARGAPLEIRSLTSLCFIAAFIVFTCHYTGRVPAAETFLSESGYIGVDIFFVLAAFVLTIRYQPSVRDHSFSWRTYLVHRVARIFPVYLFVLALTALAGEPITILNVFLLHSLSPNHIWSGLHAAWTLSVECGFYLVLPLLLRIYIPRKKPVYHIAFVLSVCAGGMLIGALLYPSDFVFVMSRTVFGYMWDFAIGIALGRIFLQYGRCPPRTGLLLIIAGLLGIVGLQWLLYQALGAFTARLLLFPVALVAAVIIYGLTAETRVARFMSMPPLVYAGRISYVFYILHLAPYAIQFLPFGYIEYYAGVTLLSIAIYQGVEVPAQKYLIRSFVTKRMLPTVATASPALEVA